MPEAMNMQILRRMYAAWDAMELDTVFALLDPEVEWINPSYAVEPGTRRGHDGFATAMHNLATSFDEYRHPEQHLWRLRDGKILELRWFHDVAEAEQAARDASRV